LTGMRAATSSGAYLIAVPHLVAIDESAKVRVIRSLEQMSFDKLTELHRDFSLSI
jgi:hypothetical protein